MIAYCRWLFGRFTFSGPTRGNPPGHGGTPPGHGGSPPGNGGNPPGQGGNNNGPGANLEGGGGSNPSAQDLLVYYRYDCWQVVEEAEGQSQALRREYTYGNYIDEPLTLTVLPTNQSGQDETYSYHQDGGFSVGVISDSSGATVERITYDAYGAPRFVTEGNADHAPQLPENTILFQGRQYDPETGLYQYRHRYYSPRLGRFASRDPLETQTLRRFTRPGLDPSGLGIWDYVVALGEAVRIGVAAAVPDVVSETLGAFATSSGRAAFSDGWVVGTVVYVDKLTLGLSSAIHEAAQQGLDQLNLSQESRDMAENQAVAGAVSTAIAFVAATAAAAQEAAYVRALRLMSKSDLLKQVQKGHKYYKLIWGSGRDAAHAAAWKFAARCASRRMLPSGLRRAYLLAYQELAARTLGTPEDNIGTQLFRIQVIQSILRFLAR